MRFIEPQVHYTMRKRKIVISNELSGSLRDRWDIPEDEAASVFIPSSSSRMCGGGAGGGQIREQ